MQKKEQDGVKKKSKPSKANYASLTEEESLDLLAELIGNRIIEQLLYDINEKSTCQPTNNGDGKKREAA
jgi:hypothetical protein